MALRLIISVALIATLWGALMAPVDAIGCIGTASPLKHRADLLGSINPPLTASQRQQMLRFVLKNFPHDSPETEDLWYMLMNLRPGAIHDAMERVRFYEVLIFLIPVIFSRIVMLGRKNSANTLPPTRRCRLSAKHTNSLPNGLHLAPSLSTLAVASASRRSFLPVFTLL